MNRFKVISLDMCQTLVNVNSRTQQVWRPIMQQIYTDERAYALSELLFRQYSTVSGCVKESGQFRTTNEVYKECFQNVFLQHAMPFDCSEAVNILFAEHRLSELYEETERFLERIVQEYQVCIVSDTDALMLPDFYKKYPVQLFTSEGYKSYKNDGPNTMFKEVIAYYGVDPKQILHIGDSNSDIIGANRVGIQACWLNREERVWNSEVNPDYIVRHLEEIYSFL